MVYVGVHIYDDFAFLVTSGRSSREIQKTAGVSSECIGPMSHLYLLLPLNLPEI